MPGLGGDFSSSNVEGLSQCSCLLPVSCSCMLCDRARMPDILCLAAQILHLHRNHWFCRSCKSMPNTWPLHKMH